MRPDAHILAIAERQHGVFTREQAIGSGLSRDQIDDRVRSGLWMRVHVGVYRARGVPSSDLSAILAAVFAAGDGAVASHTSAATIWAIDGNRRSRIHVSVRSRTGLMRPGIVVHRPRTLEASDVTTVGVIPVTRPIRTLVDLATIVGRTDLEDAIDSFIRKGLVDAATIERRLDELQPSGRRGFGVLRRLTAERVGTSVSGSVRERQLYDLLRSAGLPTPTKQFRILRTDGTFVARPDLSYPDHRIYIEFESVEHHTGRNNWERDIERQNELSALGWLPLRITARVMDNRPDRVISQVWAALAGREPVRSAQTG